MSNGRRFAAKFADQQSADNYFTWSAAQAIVYNAKVQEENYHYRFSCKFGGTPPVVDQAYSHLLNVPRTKKKNIEWFETVPSQIFRNGVVRFYRAYCNFRAGLTKRPVTKRVKAANRSLWLTSELFEIERIDQNRCVLTFGTKQNLGGRLIVKTHRPFNMPNTVVITTKGSKLFVSFTQGEEAVQPDAYPETEEEIAARLKMQTREELLAQTVGCDRGVVTPLQTQEESFRIKRVEKARVRGKKRHRKMLQKKLSRQKRGSRAWCRTSRRINDTYRYETNVRDNFAHQTSHKLVNDEKAKLIAFEDLKVTNMIARPKPKYDEAEKPLPNGAAAKSGLNRSISERAWGKTLELTKYKAQSLGKLVICVPPPYTSQTCPICGHRSKENRPKQALFACTNPECRFNEDHALTADQVAAMNIAQRAVDMLLSGEIVFKKKKRTLRMRQKSEGGLENQGRDGAARTSMQPEKAAKPVEPEKVSVTADQKAMKLEAPPNPSAVKQRTDWVG